MLQADSKGRVNGGLGPRIFKAEMLRELGFTEPNINWRNWYLTSAAELDGTIDRSLKVNLNAPDILATYTEAQLVAAMRFNLNAALARTRIRSIFVILAAKMHLVEGRRVTSAASLAGISPQQLSAACRRIRKAGECEQVEGRISVRPEHVAMVREFARGLDV